MAYRVGIHPAAQKQLLSFPEKARVDLSLSIDRLANARVKKLADSGLWRIRIGQYRVVYAIDDEAQQIIIVKAARRKEDAYKGV